MKPKQIKEVLDSAKSQDESINSFIQKLQFQHTRKQWHEFGETILELVYKFRNFDSQDLIYSTIHQLNTSLDIFVILQLVEFYLNKANYGLEQSIELLDNQKTLTKAYPVSAIYIELLKVKIYLNSNQIEKGFTLLKDAEKSLEDFRTFPKIVFALLNQVKSIYYWNKKDFFLFNQTIQKYLAYEEPQKINSKEQKEISSQAVISLLLCKSSLNFGDILENEFFQCLQNNEFSYLWDLVVIFNKGNMQDFLNYKNTKFWEKHELLKDQLEILERKIRVIILYDCIFFSGEFSKQHVSFQEVSNITQIDKSQVEKLIIHVLSIKLMEGYIDEPNELFYIQSLKPRDLDAARICQLREKFAQWNEKVNQTMEVIKKYQFFYLINKIKCFSLSQSSCCLNSHFKQKIQTCLSDLQCMALPQD